MKLKTFINLNFITIGISFLASCGGSNSNLDRINNSTRPATALELAHSAPIFSNTADGGTVSLSGGELSMTNPDGTPRNNVLGSPWLYERISIGQGVIIADRNDNGTFDIDEIGILVTFSLDAVGGGSNRRRGTYQIVVGPARQLVANTGGIFTYIPIPARVRGNPAGSIVRARDYLPVVPISNINAGQRIIIQAIGLFGVTDQAQTISNNNTPSLRSNLSGTVSYIRLGDFEGGDQDVRLSYPPINGWSLNQSDGTSGFDANQNNPNALIAHAVITYSIVWRSTFSVQSSVGVDQNLEFPFLFRAGLLFRTPSSGDVILFNENGQLTDYQIDGTFRITQ